MNLEYVDILTREILSPISVANTVLGYWPIRSSMVRGGDRVKSKKGGGRGYTKTIQFLGLK